MIISVSSQAYIFLCSIIGGAVIAFIYDIFRIKRKAIKTGNLLTFIEDLIFWVTVAIVMFAMVFYSNEGQLRSYIFIGTLLGVILYAVLLSKIVMNSSLFIIRIFTFIFKTIWLVLSYPFKITAKFLAIPADAAAKYAKTSLRSVKRMGKNRLSKASIWRKAFKNMRKKI